jgi:hypothetical protein
VLVHSNRTNGGRCGWTAVGRRLKAQNGRRASCIGLNMPTPGAEGSQDGALARENLNKLLLLLCCKLLKLETDGGGTRCAGHHGHHGASLYLILSYLQIDWIDIYPSIYLSYLHEARRWSTGAPHCPPFEPPSRWCSSPVVLTRKSARWRCPAAPARPAVSLKDVLLRAGAACNQAASAWGDEGRAHALTLAHQAGGPDRVAHATALLTLAAHLGCPGSAAAQVGTCGG